MRRACLSKDNQLVAKANQAGNNLRHKASRVNKGRQVHQRVCRRHHNHNLSHSRNHTIRRNNSRHRQGHQWAARPLHKHLAPPRNQGRNLNSNRQHLKASPKVSPRVSSKASLSNSSRRRNSCNNTLT